MTVRVLWIIKGLGPGGSERLLVAAAVAHDRTLVQPHCAYVLLAKDHLVGELEARGVPTTCLAPGHRASWPLHLRQLLARGRFDIVHIHAPAPGVVARIVIRTLPRRSRPRIVTTEHNAVNTYRLPVRFANRLTSRWDDATITVSDEALHSLRGAARRRARSLQHGIDVAAVSSETRYRAAIRAEFGLHDDDVVIGTVANFRDQKDYPNLLGAVSLLRDQGVRCRFVAVGQGPLESQIRDLVTDLCLDDIVTLTGYRSDATEVMAAFDVFVLASKYEGLPVALMEALALGLPIVATAVGGVGEALTDGVDAILVPPSDPVSLAVALAELVVDPDRRASLGTASRALAESFDMRKAASEIEAIYSSLLPVEARNTDATDPAAPDPAATARLHSNRLRSTRLNGLTIREASIDDRSAMIEMMRGPLQWGDDDRNARFFSWKHDQNPFGPSPTWIALDGDQVVAVRTFMRWQFRRGETIIDTVRAVDTVTDPAHQGRGLFRELTMVGVHALTDAGVSWVFNTPNDQSRPGYLSMGWREVGQLPTAVIPLWSHAPTIARSRVPADRWSDDLDVGVTAADWLDRGGFERWSARPRAVAPRALVTPLSESFLRWRYGTDLLPYRVVECGDAAAVIRARRRGPSRELVVALTLGDSRRANALVRRTLREARCDHALRLGQANPLRGSVPMAGAGPGLTWRSLHDVGEPPLSNWQLSLGDIELF